jgi:hypothetical protein
VATLIVCLSILITRYCRPENVGIETIVVPELKLGDATRHIFGARL